MSDISRKALLHQYLINRREDLTSKYQFNAANEFETILKEFAEFFDTESEGEATSDEMSQIADALSHQVSELMEEITHLKQRIAELEDEKGDYFDRLPDESLSSHREDVEIAVQPNLTHNDIFQLRCLVNDNGADAIIGLIRSWGIKDGRDNT